MLLLTTKVIVLKKPEWMPIKKSQEHQKNMMRVYFPPNFITAILTNIPSFLTTNLSILEKISISQKITFRRPKYPTHPCLKLSILFFKTLKKFKWITSLNLITDCSPN